MFNSKILPNFISNTLQLQKNKQEKIESEILDPDIVNDNNNNKNDNH